MKNKQNNPILKITKPSHGKISKETKMGFINRQLNKELKRTFFVLINPHISRLLTTPNFVVMHYVLTKTLGFGYDHFTTSFLLSVKDETKILPATSTISKSTLYQCLSELQNLNFIYRHPHSRPAQYIVNSPAIIFAILKLFTLSELPVNEKERHVKAANDTYSIYEKNKVYLPRNLNLPEIVFMDIVEAINKGKNTTKKAKDKKLEKIKKKADPNIANMIRLFKETCRQLEVQCFFLPEFTGKEKGQAKRFISECKDAGLKLSDVIEDVCKYWRFFYNTMKTDKGKEMEISNVVNFPQFFLHRRAIQMAIQAHSERWDNQSDSVIINPTVDLNEWAKAREEKHAEEERKRWSK